MTTHMPIITATCVVSTIVGADDIATRYSIPPELKLLYVRHSNTAYVGCNIKNPRLFQNMPKKVENVGMTKVHHIELTYHACPWLLCPLLLFNGSRLNKEDVVDTVDFTDAIDQYIHTHTN